MEAVCSRDLEGMSTEVIEDEFLKQILQRTKRLAKIA